MKDYLENWNNHKSPKPVNDENFISEFKEFMRSKNKDHYHFEGENGYCGFTATLHEVEPAFQFSRCMSFEFAYGADFVKVFTAHHQGFWVPEYISLKGEDAQEILSILSEKCSQWSGFNISGSIATNESPDSSLDKGNLLEIAKAVAHIGVDFGYGKYEIEDQYIRLARSLFSDSAIGFGDIEKEAIENFSEKENIEKPFWW